MRSRTTSAATCSSSSCTTRKSTSIISRPSSISSPSSASNFIPSTTWGKPTTITPTEVEAPSRRMVPAYVHQRRAYTYLSPSCFETPTFGGLLVLARTAIVRPFREERPGPGGHLDRAAGRRIGCSRAARAAAEQDRDRFFIGPGWLKEPRVRITRKGSTKMSKDTTVCAGIDTGKHKLDVAIDGGAERAQVDNNSEGHRSLLAWLRQREVERIGIEASGGYEQAVVSSLRADGFVVIIFQPVQVRAYASFVLQHAKNDTIDAVLIARCTAAATDIREPPDARLALLAQHLTMIEQLTEDVGQVKTRR